MGVVESRLSRCCATKLNVVGKTRGVNSAAAATAFTSSHLALFTSLASNFFVIHNLFIAIPIQSQPASSLASTLPLALLLHPLLLPSLLFLFSFLTHPPSSPGPLAWFCCLCFARHTFLYRLFPLTARYLSLSLKPLGFFFTLFILIMAHFLSCPFCISSVRPHFPPLLLIHIFLPILYHPVYSLCRWDSR